MSAQICGSKSRGRQRRKYTDSLNNFVTRNESPNNELIRRTATDLVHDNDDYDDDDDDGDDDEDDDEEEDGDLCNNLLCRSLKPTAVFKFCL